MPTFYIIDTNVVIAGLITSQSVSPVAQVLDRMLSAALPFVLSPALLAEYRSVMLRPKIAACHGLLAHEVDTILTDIARHAVILQPGQPVPHHVKKPDPGDQMLWDLLALRSDLVLVTGDLRLLASSAAMAPRVVAPAMLIGRLTH
jgi:putative PIN family toxin of toxin-antitoxin system